MVLLCVAICLYGVVCVAPIYRPVWCCSVLPYVCMALLVLLLQSSMVLLCVAIICLYGVARVAHIDQYGVVLCCHTLLWCCPVLQCACMVLLCVAVTLN